MEYHIVIFSFNWTNDIPEGTAHTVNWCGVRTIDFWPSLPSVMCHIMFIMFGLRRCELTEGVGNEVPRLHWSQLTLIFLSLFSLPLPCHFHLFIKSISSPLEYVSGHLVGRHVPELNKQEFVFTRHAVRSNQLFCRFTRTSTTAVCSSSENWLPLFFVPAR